MPTVSYYRSMPEPDSKLVNGVAEQRGYRKNHGPSSGELVYCLLRKAVDPIYGNSSLLDRTSSTHKNLDTTVQCAPLGSVVTGHGLTLAHATDPNNAAVDAFTDQETLNCHRAPL